MKLITLITAFTCLSLFSNAKEELNFIEQSVVFPGEFDQLHATEGPDVNVSLILFLVMIITSFLVSIYMFIKKNYTIEKSTVSIFELMRKQKVKH